MSKDLMKYDQLAQDALRGVVRMALERVRDEGLPGTHHFFIAFRTGFDGVDISDALRARYPAEMTIVLQHQFWDLEVDDEKFAVTLSFNKMPERLVVPFQSVQGFYDPSVQFGLNFQVEGEGDLEPAEQLAFPPAEDGASPEDAKNDPEHTPDIGGPPAVGESDGTGESADVVNLDSFRSRKK